MSRVEDKIDTVLEALDVDTRPACDVLQDVLDDEITQREAAEELGWSASRVQKAIHVIQEGN